MIKNILRRRNVALVKINKGIRHATSALSVELYKHAGVFKCTREVLRDARAVGTSQVFLKIPKCFLYNSTIHEEQVFLFLL